MRATVISSGVLYPSRWIAIRKQDRDLKRLTNEASLDLLFIAVAAAIAVSCYKTFYDLSPVLCSYLVLLLFIPVLMNTRAGWFNFRDIILPFLSRRVTIDELPAYDGILTADKDAAINGDAEAQYELGIKYRDAGISEIKSKALGLAYMHAAEYWLRRAMEHGHQAAMDTLAAHLRRCKSPLKSRYRSTIDYEISNLTQEDYNRIYDFPETSTLPIMGRRSPATTKRPLWSDAKAADSNLKPSAFVLRAYASEMAAGALHLGVIRQEDPDLHRVLMNRRRTDPTLGGLNLQTYPEWNTDRLKDRAALTDGRDTTDTRLRERRRLWDIARKRAAVNRRQRPDAP